jgi:membrane protease YdiL (CAAX protease family)
MYMVVSKINAKILLVSVFIIFAFEIPMGIAVAKRWLSPLPTIGVVRLLEIVVLVLIIIMLGKGLSSIGLAQDQWIRGCKRGLIWSVAFGACTALGFTVLFLFQINPIMILGRGLPFKGNDLAVFMLVGVLISPIAEEIFFRGIVYGFLRRWGVVLAVSCTTIIFGAIHLKSGNFPLTQVVGGILFAIAYEVEGNLMVPITIHVLGNMAIFTIPLMV